MHWNRCDIGDHCVTRLRRGHSVLCENWKRDRQSFPTRDCRRLGGVVRCDIRAYVSFALRSRAIEEGLARKSPRAEVRDRFESTYRNRSWRICSHEIEMKFKPNKAPEPTPTSVTDRANARSAPAAVVAHL